MKFEEIMLNEGSQTHTKGNILCDSIYRKCSKQANLQRQKVEQQVTVIGVPEDWGVTAKYFRVFFEVGEPGVTKNT